MYATTITKELATACHQDAERIKYPKCVYFGNFTLRTAYFRRWLYNSGPHGVQCKRGFPNMGSRYQRHSIDSSARLATCAPSAAAPCCCILPLRRTICRTNRMIGGLPARSFPGWVTLRTDLTTPADFPLLPRRRLRSPYRPRCRRADCPKGKLWIPSTNCRHQCGPTRPSLQRSRSYRLALTLERWMHLARAQSDS